MFYSHTFLARKGPLGTVWCAAHLQHKLKKSHYASTNIPSTVERIIFPEVPIALRMSGHLLLGVVRIYSKQVDYLHHDCNVLCVSLRNAFRHVNVNLPENATQAQFNSITLPETYALDALDIDDDLSVINESQDDHLRSLEEITLKDQYHPAESELYVRITFDDDIIPDSTQSEQVQGDPMQIDDPPEISVPLSPPMQIDDRNQNDGNGRSEGEDLPPYEVMRDNNDNDVQLHSPILRPPDGNVDPKPNISPPKDTIEKGIDTLLLLDTSTQEISHQSLQHEGPSSPTTEAYGVSGSFVNVSPTELLLRPTPSAEKPQPQPQQRKRKRKQNFDESLVLTNAVLKNMLDNCSDLVKKKKKLPCSALELWRFKEKIKNEEVFSEPLISGMCANLQNLSREDFISSNPKLLVTEAAQLESRGAESSAPAPNAGEETERLRSADHDPGHNFEQMFPASTPISSPKSLGNAETSTSPRIPSSVSEPRFGTTDTQSDMGMFTRSTGFEMETPIMDIEERTEELSTALSDIPEWRNSMEDELSFLEQDNNSPSDSQGTPTGDTMSTRTRAVAQYLKDHSPLSKFPDGPSQEINLSAILDGRRRKLCARMFYETLVLKDRGLIDIQQAEPYGDITLKLTSSLSMAKI